MNESAPFARCGACGFDLSGTTESGRCPECGRPIVETLVRPQTTARIWESRARLFGMPAIAIAHGLDGQGRPAQARGWIAIGPRARGVLALGGQVTGILAAGGISVGVVSAGGVSVGLVSAGGLAFGLLLAIGGGAIGGVAIGGLAAGIFAIGGSVLGPNTWGPLGPSGPGMRNFGDLLGTFLPRRANGLPDMWAVQALLGGVVVALATLLGTPAIVAWLRADREKDPGASEDD